VLAALDGTLVLTVAAEHVAGDGFADVHQGEAVLGADTPADTTRLAFVRGQADQAAGGRLELTGDRPERAGRMVEVLTESP
jgi:hypothetical protein